MAQISINVNGKSHLLACADGEEEQLKQLAEYVNSKTVELTEKLGHVSESKLLLMASLLIADELNEALEGKGQQGIIGGISEDDLAGILTEVAVEVEGIADQLAKS
ncbi:cell division protein ZapA [Kordiimonas sp. SCSIO 12610]|uniref:cell division protein ZapA n=1 Tax=Kordiimonas sp. SCSIO 12610 TaxID=2829597 RepID=UPI00210A4558|nr:cell division protein ZapA [Kordiimonas sp. SCSIO 12610]UTW54990.1 cell division protein ZapA [Kordiimonas sp. SCSIO 12610]